MLENHLRPGDGVLDIGANVGAHASRYARAVGQSGYVLAVEPDPSSVEIARKALAEYPWVTVLQAAVAGAHGEALLCVDRGERARNSLWPSNVLELSDQVILTRTVTLDYLADVVPNLRGIKIDTQGAEMAILRGGLATLQRPELVWCVEIWPEGLTNAGSSAEELIAMFERYGWVPPEGWQMYRDHAPNQRGHSSMDALIVRKAA